jgi:hypothetical protein
MHPARINIQTEKRLISMPHQTVILLSLFAVACGFSKSTDDHDDDWEEEGEWDESNEEA